jgi:flagellar protein FliT
MPEMTDMDMAQQERIILRYEAMAAITGAMLAAARTEEWDTLVTLESDCAAQVAALKREEPSLSSEQHLPMQQLSMQQRERKASLIEQMLADDGALRQLIAARMAQLSNKVNSTRTERKLSRAYGG